MNGFFSRLGRGLGRGDATGRGRGGGNQPGSGPRGKCICPQCGYSTGHEIGKRCMDMTCPKCGTSLIKTT
jgi:hypothetical protein